MPRIACFVFAAVMCLPSNAGAQTPATYVEASGLISTQGSTPSGEFGGTGVGGTSPGIGASFGVELHPSVSLVAEFSFPSRLEVVQDFSHFLVWRDDDRYRDMTLSETVHVRLGSGRVRPELVGGVSFVDQQLAERRAYGGDQFSNPSPLGPYSAWQYQSSWTLGIVFGGDVPIRVREHFAIVPQFRVYMIQRNFEFGSATLGLASTVIRPAIAGRWAFGP